MPGRLRNAVRDLRELPGEARVSWLKAALRRVMGDDRRAIPVDLAQRPRILFVCHGNIYRSPMAAMMFAREAERYGFVYGSVGSAGFIGGRGRSSPPDAVRLAAQHGIRLDEHRSRLLSDELIAESDLIVLMDRRNEALLATLAPEALNRSVLLGAFDGGRGGTSPVIPDPYGRGSEVVAGCYERIAKATHGLLDALSGRAPDPATHLRPVLRAKAAAHRILTSSPLLPLWASGRREAASILMLHRFANPDLGIPGHDPRVLAENLEYLRRHRFHICSLHELVERLRERRSPKPNTVVFTVDDGYSDFVEVGAPVFARYDVPATTFLVTSFVDSGQWIWYDVLRYCAMERVTARVTVPVRDETVLLEWRNSAERRSQIRRLIARLNACPAEVSAEVVRVFPELLGVSLPERPTPQYAPVRWQQVRDLESQGMRYAPHTHTHPILSRVTTDRARQEIQESWARIQSESRAPTPVLCYPSGQAEDFSERDSVIARETGLVAAVAAFGGRVDRGVFAARPFAVPRIPYPNSAASFRWQVAG